jgi:hypothetical protein
MAEVLRGGCEVEEKGDGNSRKFGRVQVASGLRGSFHRSTGGSRNDEEMVRTTLDGLAGVNRAV